MSQILYILRIERVVLFFCITGLCGNFNGDKTDDLTLRNGTKLAIADDIENKMFTDNANTFSLDYKYDIFITYLLKKW